MKDFNEFIEYRKPLKRIMDNLSESDGIMLEEMFYEFVNHQKSKTESLTLERKELTYEQRVRWFVNNYYETGMEYEAMLDDMKDKDLDNFQWYSDTFKIPKYKDEI